MPVSNWNSGQLYGSESHEIGINLHFTSYLVKFNEITFEICTCSQILLPELKVSLVNIFMSLVFRVAKTERTGLRLAYECFFLEITDQGRG